MRLAWMAKRMLIREDGFSIAEVMVAFLILAIAVIPMVGMFDGAFRVSRVAYDMNLAQECLRLYIERVRNIPFYYAHTEEDLTSPMDVDDFYWGNRSPIYNNTWDNAPEVVMKDSTVDPYPGMSVTIKMAYVDEEEASGRTLVEAAEATELASDWRPMSLYGYDRAKTSSGKALNLILYEIKVTMADGRFITDSELYASPTDVVANVYIDEVVNISTDTTKLGTRYNAFGECISAPHHKSSITIRAYGEGFTQSDLIAGLVDLKLVRVDDNDISPANLTYGEEGGRKYLEGVINLDSGGKSAPTNVWYPRRKPGYWHAWLVVNHIISVRSDIFVVEYPVPVYNTPGSSYSDSDGNKFGRESSTDEVLTFTNVGYVTDLLSYNYPNPGVGAVVQLVHTETRPDTGEPVDVITCSHLSINPTANKGYQNGLLVTAKFNFNRHVGGYYKVRIINCIERATPDINVMGNTYIELPESENYYLEGPPGIYDVYVKGYVDPGEVYVQSATPQIRSFGYDDRPYMYWLRVEGVNFDSFVTLKMGKGSSAPPSGDVVFDAVRVNWIDQHTLEAVFDFAPYVGPGYYGQYWLYAENSNGFGSVLNPAFEIRRPAPIIYDYRVNTYGLWQNYYDVAVSIEGECFDRDPLTGTDFQLRIQEVANFANDWLATEAMGDPTPSEYGRHVEAKLNLVDCNLGSWIFYGLSTPDGLTDYGFTDTLRPNPVSYLTELDITLGAPILLTATVPTNPADYSLIIMSRYKPMVNGAWRDWSDWDESMEGVYSTLPKWGGIYNAWAWENDPAHSTPEYRTMGEMYFKEIRGMGFAKEGGLRVQVENNDSPPHAGMRYTWTGLTVHMDRTRAKVWVEMDETMKASTGPDEGGMGRIRLRNESSGIWQDWYMDRIAFRPEG
ncbi:MAG: type IV pilus modification PilV family protein [Actinomycetota bacterium]